MNLTLRVFSCVAILGAGTVGQVALVRHIQSAGEVPVVPLEHPLIDLPLTVGDWTGREEPVEAKLRYGDDHLKRTYVHSSGRHGVALWMAYSSKGKDRGHHPEVCMAVAGLPEDEAVRQTLEVPGHEQPVQQYRFGHAGQRQWVFYWHYTLAPPPQKGLDWLQTWRRQLTHHPGSLTVEVFGPEQVEGDVEAARDFVQKIDAALQRHLPPGAVRGSSREPVIMTN